MYWFNANYLKIEIDNQQTNKTNYVFRSGYALLWTKGVHIF